MTTARNEELRAAVEALDEAERAFMDVEEPSRWAPLLKARQAAAKELTGAIEKYYLNGVFHRGVAYVLGADGRLTMIDSFPDVTPREAAQ